jgi:chromosome segregation ATPase
MSESDCQEAKAELAAAASELADAEEKYNRSLVVVFDARKALEDAREKVNVASHHGGVAERAVGDAEERLSDQKWVPDYEGKERDVAQKEEQLAEAREAFRRATDETNEAVATSNAAKDAFDRGEAELAKHKAEFESAQGRHGRWAERVREVCGE